MNAKAQSDHGGKGLCEILHECAETPALLGEDPPALEVGYRTFDGSADTGELLVELRLMFDRGFAPEIRLISG